MVVEKQGSTVQTDRDANISPGDPLSPRSVVFGAGGFIGQAIWQGLIARKMPVLAVGRNLAAAAPDDAVYNGTIVSSRQVCELLRKGDIIYDALGMASPASLSTFSDEAAAEELRLHGFIVDAAVRAGARKLILVSSGGTVYGDPRSMVPIREDHPVAPISPYGLLKVQTEEIFATANRTGLLEAVVARMANPYGPGQIQRRAQGFIAAAFEKSLKGKSIELWGDGSHVRDYIYIDDARDALIMASALPGGAICHISSGVGRSIQNVVVSIAEVLGQPLDVRHNASQPAGVPCNILSNVYLKSAVAWAPRISWGAGLATTAAWWRERLAGEISVESN